VESVGDDRQIGQFGHGQRIVAAKGPVLDSPGPRGRQLKTRPASSLRRERTAAELPRTTADRSEQAWALPGPSSCLGTLRQETSNR
jgi:hypothetical protein